MLARRIALYATGTATLAVLVWLGWFQQPPPDYWELQRRFLDCVAEEDDEGLAEINELFDDHYADDVRVPLLRGWLAEQRRDLASAESLYRDALPLCDDDDQRNTVGVSIADLMRRRGEIDAANEELDRVIATHGKSSRARILRVLIRLDEGKSLEALSELELLAEEDPGNPQLTRLRTMVRELGEAKPSGHGDTRSGQ